MKVITFLTDFGLEDEFVGVCHGVIERIAPGTRVIDINHGIRPQAVLAGRAQPGERPDVHAGRRPPRRRRPRGRRRPPRGGAARLGRPALRRPRQRPARARGGAVGRDRRRARADEPRALARPVSWTFHARDIFSPVAAHLAAGRPLEDVGPAVDPVDARARRPAEADRARGPDRRALRCGRPLRQRRAERPSRRSRSGRRSQLEPHRGRAGPASATTRSPRRPSRTSASARSSSTRTPTATSRSPSRAAARRRRS